MSSHHYEVIIVGGAIIGSAVAYFLTRDPAFRGRVLVIEKDPSYAKSSTTLSAASIRQQFSTPTNIRISQFGIEFLRSLAERFGPGADIGLRENGYLLLASPSGLPILEGNHRIQREHGVDVALLDGPALQARFPWLNVQDLAAGCLGLSGEGWFDAYSLLQLLRRAAREQGAEYVDGEVVAIERNGEHIRGVRLGDGRTYTCGELVNAAGAAAGRVAALAGIALPVEPRKRCVFVFACKERPRFDDCPLVVDPSGLYFRPEGEYFITGLPPRPDPECWDFEVDHGLFDEHIWPILANRVPAFEAIKLINAWAGHYDYNTLDQNAVVGRHPAVGNLIFANGFSGHGLQQAPAVGRGVAELIVHGGYRSLDLSVFGYERIVANRPVRELNVI
ncbi:MAG TPA: FAD-binding oxidoreductase [Candidatus Competibacteraceae bacterium]|nr:FAD-binding oxidoreductase [Candidatus Competibacteraceae bacterium]